MQLFASAKERKRADAYLRMENAKYSEQLRHLPRESCPHPDGPQIAVLRSKEFLVQVFPEANDVLRLSISRARMLANGRWDDGISWDELQRLKREAGYADRYAVEVFPADKDVVNVANMRHLWLLTEPPPFAWKK